MIVLVRCRTALCKSHGPNIIFRVLWLEKKLWVTSHYLWNNCWEKELQPLLFCGVQTALMMPCCGMVLVNKCPARQWILFHDSLTFLFEYKFGYKCSLLVFIVCRPYVTKPIGKVRLTFSEDAGIWSDLLITHSFFQQICISKFLCWDGAFEPSGAEAPDEELMSTNSSVGEDSGKSLWQQGLPVNLDWWNQLLNTARRAGC